MAKVLCTATCYMPSKKRGVKFERYEDEDEVETGIYEIPNARLDEFLESGNFKQVE